MRTTAGVLVCCALGLFLGGAVTLGIFCLLSALACDLLAETFDAQ